MTSTDKSPIDYFSGESLGGDEIGNLDTVTPQVEESEVDEVGGQSEEEGVDTFQEEVEDTSEEEEEVSNTDEDDLEEDEDAPTGAYLLAKDFINDGSLPEDFEFDKNLTGTELKKALWESAVGDFDIDTYAKTQGMDENTVKIAKAINQGVHPNMAFEINQYTAIANADIEDNEGAVEQILKLYYSDKGIEEDIAKDILSRKIENGEDFEEARKAQKYFAGKAKELQKSEEQKQEEYSKKVEESKNNILRKIKDKSVKGLKIDDKEAKELSDYMYKETEVDTITVGGKPQKIMVSKFKKDYNEFQRDPDKFIRMAYNIMKGFDVDTIKKESAVDAAVSHIDALNRRVSKNGTKKKKKDKSSELFANLRMLG